MGGAPRGGMHPLLFHFKRAHWRCVGVFGKEIRELEMTCARLEVMHAIDKSVYRLMTQAQLARLLGVRRQTIWEIVDRMVRLRLVRKIRGRRVVVQLTAKGRRRVKKARRLLRFASVQRTLRTCFPWLRLKPRRARRDISLLKWHTRTVARGLGDTSSYGDSIDPIFHPKPPDFARNFARNQERKRRQQERRALRDTPRRPSPPPTAPDPAPAPAERQSSPPAPRERSATRSDGLWRVDVFAELNAAARGGPTSRGWPR